MKNQESKISREFPLLGIFEYLTYHCESKVLSPVRNFRDCTFAIIRRVNFAFLFFSSISMERHFSDSHDINVKFTEKVVELERIPRDWREIFFFLFFLSTFRFIIRGNLYYISQLWERFPIAVLFYFSVCVYFYLFTMEEWTFVYLKCVILIFMKRKIPTTSIMHICDILWNIIMKTRCRIINFPSFSDNFLSWNSVNFINWHLKISVM